LKILVIPDTQCRPGVRTDHMTWIGRCAIDLKPDFIIHLGDHFDMPSLNTWSKSIEVEGRRVIEDLESGKKSLAKLLAPIDDYNKGKKNKFLPGKHFLMGNHEERLFRYIRENPCLEGVFSEQSFGLDGWSVHKFLETFQIKGIWFSHYFVNPNSSRPWAGTAHSKLKNIGLSFVMGHQQGLDLAVRALPNGKQQRGLVAGSCYLHRENYRTPQGKESFQGIIILNDVRDSTYDLMELSLRYLKRKFG